MSNFHEIFNRRNFRQICLSWGTPCHAGTNIDVMIRQTGSTFPIVRGEGEFTLGYFYEIGGLYTIRLNWVTFWFLTEVDDLCSKSPVAINLSSWNGMEDLNFSYRGILSASCLMMHSHIPPIRPQTRKLDYRSCREGGLVVFSTTFPV